MHRNTVIVDSGSANLSSMAKALLKAGVKAQITANPASIARARAVLFPGVGAFGYAMELLKANGLAKALIEVIASGKPFLGICLGLQLLFADSEERRNQQDPLPQGLNIIPGRVKRFPPAMAVPHVGWNRVFAQRPHPLFDELPDGTYFYFTHSFFVQPEESAVVLAQTDYGCPFTSAVASKNLMGVQFHPEKSGPDGLHLLRNFGKIISDPTLVA